MIRFGDTTREQAEEFCAHVVAREPYRLRDLAERMRATGGPVEAMDASVDSLVPLWEWFVGYLLAGCPEVPHDAVPSRVPFPPDRSPEGERRRRRAAACEGVAHYVRLVVERMYGQAPWVVLVSAGGKDFRHHETVIALPVGHLQTLFVPTMASHADQDRLSARDPHKLRDVFLRSIGVTAPPRQDPGRSVLVPYLTAELPPMPEEARVSPVARWEAEAAARAATGVPAVPRQPRAGSEMVLANGPGRGLEDKPRLLRPLPLDVVADGLTAAGFVSDGADRVHAAHLLINDAHFIHRDEVAVISTFVHGRKLRALFLQPLAGSRAQWDAMELILRGLAATLGARLAPEDQFD